MTERIWLWHFGDYAVLADVIQAVGGDDHCALVDGNELDFSQAEVSAQIHPIAEMPRDFSLLRVSGRRGLEGVLELDDWNIAVTLSAASADPAVAIELVQKHAYDDSRSLSIHCLDAEALRLLSLWPYSVWLSPGAVDARYRCLIRTTDPVASAAFEELLHDQGRGLGIGRIMGARLKETEFVELPRLPRWGETW